jgi:hypothetical protein
MDATLPPPARTLPLTDTYSRQERERIAAELNAGRTIVCPRCGGSFALSSVAAPPGVAYVRKRSLAVCTGCHRSLAIDLKRG